MIEPWTTYEPSDDDRQSGAIEDTMRRYYDVLEAIDAMGYAVSDWEATFLETVLTSHRYLSAKEQAIVTRMAWRYLHEEI